MLQGSPNQAKWVTSSPWFQWNRPISVKKSEVLVLVHIFFTNNHTFSSIFTFPCSWNLTHTGFDVQYFIPNSLIASFLRSLCSTFVLWKVGEHAVVGKETLKVCQLFPHFALKSREREVKSPCFYYVWWALVLYKIFMEIVQFLI